MEDTPLGQADAGSGKTGGWRLDAGGGMRGRLEAELGCWWLEARAGGAMRGVRKLWKM